ncbi:MAG: (d)CMP kinase [Sphingomonas sp.]|uniref:(d)CMP kinase n=1 Tax=Sphingomonas sp. TaxID=28214 RepID=UPI00182F5F65|nr:(d)CMP kinase [Sphingomonas sp.]MBA3667772.1 (d)CMP kinase [Sphingomonas sp.]
MSSTVPLVIAVDGPAASGKGTIARALAKHFGLPHMDTGSLYRAAALTMVRFGGDPGSEFEAVRACAQMAQITADDPELRSEIVGSIASRISAYPGVRAALLERQRAFARQAGGAVLDGRDIGSVIAPFASAKLFVTASIEVRAARRMAELEERGMPAHLEEIVVDLAARDARDQERADAPLTRAGDAQLLDTSGMGVEAAVAAAIAMVQKTR